MKKLLPALLCSLALASSAFADTCLNTDKEKYADNDVRSHDYGKCKNTGPNTNYNSLNAIGSQMQNMMQRRDEEQSASSRASAADRESRRAEVAEWDRTRFSKLKYVMAKEVIPMNMNSDVQAYANARVTSAEADAIRAEIGQAIQQGKLLASYDDGSHEKPWVSAIEPAQNWKTCEVATQLIRAHVYGDFIKPEEKNPAKGFAIARAACDAHCGGGCYWLGRIYEDGNEAAPGVDKVLGHEPQTLTLQAYDNAIFNGVNAAYERAALVNWLPPARYRDKTYFRLSDFSFDNHYWYDIGDYRRLAYAQYKRCLQLEPANLACAKGINALIKDTQGNSYVWRDELKEINADGKIAWFQEYEIKLEGLLKAQSAAKP